VAAGNCTALWAGWSVATDRACQCSTDHDRGTTSSISTLIHSIIAGLVRIPGASNKCGSAVFTLLKLSSTFFTCRSGRWTSASRVTIRSNALYGCCVTMSITKNLRLVLPNRSRSNLISPRTISAPTYSTSSSTNVLVSLLPLNQRPTARLFCSRTYRDQIQSCASNSNHRTARRATSAHCIVTRRPSLPCALQLSASTPSLKHVVNYPAYVLCWISLTSYLGRIRILLIARTIFQKWYRTPPSVLCLPSSPVLLY